MKKVAKNLAETSEIAHQVLESILSGLSDRALVLGLSGDLGAGKTAFTQALASHLGVGEQVQSPTFVLMKKYDLKNQKYSTLYHLDVYRLEKEQELLDLGWLDIISNEKNLVIIEWPEKVMGAMPEYARYLYIKNGDDESRIFELK